MINSENNPFEEGDVRKEIVDLMTALSERQLTEEEAKRAAELYLQLIDCCFEKFNALLDERNMFAMLLTPLLTTKTLMADTELALKTTNEHWNGFMDTLLSVYLLRTMEAAGKVQTPFTITITTDEEEKDAP